MQPISIHSRRTINLDGNVRVIFGIEGIDPDELWFEIPREWAGFADDGYDAALLALLVPAMEVGKMLQVEGPASPLLAWSINRRVISLLRLAFPQLAETRLTVNEETVGDARPGDAVLTALSGGIDSFTAYIDHVESSDTPDDRRVTHLLFNDVGGHHPDKGETLREQRLSQVRGTASEFGMPLIAVNSNMNDFYRGEFIKSHTLRNAAIALFLQGGARAWFYASTFKFADTRVAPTHDIASIDPILLPLLSTERMYLALTGSERSRVEKTRLIAKHPVARRRLDICFWGPPNCSRCEKCLSTMLTLDLLGDLEHFGGVFDLLAYTGNRDRFMSEILASDRPRYREIVALMKDRGFQPTGSVRRRAAALRRFRPAIGFLHRLTSSHPWLRLPLRSKWGRRLADQSSDIDPGGRSPS